MQLADQALAGWDLMRTEDSTNEEGSELMQQFCSIHEKTEALYEIIIETPCCLSKPLSNKFDVDLYLKKEYQQVTGSFKARGCLFALLNMTETEKQNGVVVGSSGNHAIALAYHGMRLGITVTAVVPKSTPNCKKFPIETYGANIIVHGETMMEARSYAKRLAVKERMKFIDLDPMVVYGQGTVAMEILEQIPDVNAILVPIGSGGLIAGTALTIEAFKPDVQIIGVRIRENLNKTDDQFPVPKGLVSPYTGEKLSMVNDKISAIVTVDEDDVSKAMLTLAETEKIVVEGASALVIAALQSGELEFLKGKKVVAVLTGGNIDKKTMSNAFARALYLEGRI